MARRDIIGRRPVRLGADGVIHRRRRRRTGVDEPPPISRPIGRFVRNAPVQKPFRAEAYTHISDLVHTCMRKVALASELKAPIPTEPNWSSMQLTHAMGSACAEWVTEQVLAQTDNVYGSWACRCGDTVIGPVTRREALEHEECENCGYRVDRYREFQLRDDDYMLVGNCDLAFLESGWLILTELKSISKNQFDNLEDAKSDHKIQLYLYCFLAQRAGYKVHHQPSVFYTCRDWMWGDPFKEFNLDLSIMERRLRPYLEEARQIKEWKHDHGPVPERIHCNTIDSTRARECALCAECFLRG